MKFRDPDVSVHERVVDLLDRLTLDEKKQWMTHEWPAIERLGIPRYSWLNECLHGVARAGTATVFPQAIGMAASWNPERLKKVASAIGDEARAKHHESIREGDRGMYKGLTFYSPNINIFRDPRWGRGHETYGEDPYLTARMAVAFVQGLQGDDPTYMKAAACAKHFAVHSGPESQRMTYDARPSRRDLEETYLPAFRAAVMEGGVASVMSAYNRLYGEPCCASRLLNEETLRQRWGFEGFVVSDGGAFDFVHDHHMVTRGPMETVAISFRGGCDMELGDVCRKGLEPALEQGMLTVEDLDRALFRTLTVLFRLGWFDPEDRVPYASIPYDVVACPEHLELARTMAEESMVLLTNRNETLPLAGAVRNIAVIGPNADSRSVLYGNYHGTASRPVTALEGISARAEAHQRVWYAQGCDLTNVDVFFAFGPKDRNLSEAVAAARRSDVAVLCMGLDPTMEGENGDPNAGATDVGGDRRSLDLPACQVELIEAVLATGTPTVMVLFGGSPMTLGSVYDRADAVLQVFYPGERGGEALARILFGDAGPSGRLPFTIPHTSDQLPPFADYGMEGRTYRFVRTPPQFAFGHGLSYTTFAYGIPKANRQSVSHGDTVEVSVSVENTGTRAGSDVVQLYVRHPESKRRTPVRHLEGFQRVELEPGQKEEVVFELTERCLRVVSEEGESILESGRVIIELHGGQAGQGEQVELEVDASSGTARD